MPGAAVSLRPRLPRLGRRGPIPRAQRPAPSLAPFLPFTFRLPWPTSANRIWRADRHTGVVLKSVEAREWQKAAAASLLVQRVPVRHIARQMTVTIHQHARTAAGDVDNGVKLVLDTLKRCGVIYDDSRRYVRRLVVEDVDRSEEPEGWILVSIEPYARQTPPQALVGSG